jgi:Na+-transporting methylmalonyl-CoA/oxaloacetate decarboxylase gamma subunit
MTNFDFGLTLTVLGMGGTITILFLISLIVDGLNRMLLQLDKKKEGKE